MNSRPSLKEPAVDFRISPSSLLMGSSSSSSSSPLVLLLPHAHSVTQHSTSASSDSKGQWAAVLIYSLDVGVSQENKHQRAAPQHFWRRPINIIPNLRPEPVADGVMAECLTGHGKEVYLEVTFFPFETKRWKHEHASARHVMLWARSTPTFILQAKPFLALQRPHALLVRPFFQGLAEACSPVGRSRGQTLSAVCC